MEKLEFFDEDALLERLTHGILRTDRPVVFLLGSPVSAPQAAGQSGVPAVTGIIELIREEFGTTSQITELEAALQNSSENAYQAAFRFLLGRRGQQVANEVIKRAVWKARKKVLDGAGYVPSETTSDEVCRALDSDLEGWVLAPAVESVGRLMAGYPDRFGQTCLTTNFDPLLEVSIARAGCPYFRTILHRDGNLSQTEGSGCHVIHLHGYWHGADTLHTPRQLNQPRPRLKASLASLIKGRTLVISGYGGWDDTFTDALMEVVLDDSAYPEIIWTFNSAHPTVSDTLADKLAPGFDRGRVSLYSNIDCHAFFPRLFQGWTQLEAPAPHRYVPARSNKLHFIIGEPPSKLSVARTTSAPRISRIIEGNDEDRPPLIEFCVGRDEELSRLMTSDKRVCFIHGLGGQGKSTLAAKFFSEAQKHNLFDLFVWRDCKEEAERLETQIIRIIEQLSAGTVRGSGIANNDIGSLTKLLIRYAENKRMLFVFDNVDHYVDLENNRFSSVSEGLIRTFLSIDSRCMLVFTCRPSIQYPELPVLSQRVEGLSLSATVELFGKRSADSTPIEIEEAHAFTRGHAFWLDLLAAQVARKSPSLKLSSLLDRSASDAGEMPLATLQSIWETLADREQLVLRALAESVKPETESRLGEYLRGRLNYNRLMKALRSLRSLNLIVVKAKEDSADVVELHPLVRQFIKLRFPRQERIAFIDAILVIYTQLIGVHRTELRQRPSFSVLQNWTESAELDIESGKVVSAFERLFEVAFVFEDNEFPGEFARVAKLLFRDVDWDQPPPAKYLDVVIATYVRILSHFGRFTEAEELLTTFEKSLRTRDARFINYCDIRCYTNWIKRDFSAAIAWGKQGRELKNRSDVDTERGTEHNLALAQRDAGDIDPALEFFLFGRPLAEVTDPDELDENRGAPHYGNVGRCLHIMGQIDPAIVCYRKSAILLEKDAKFRHTTNQGYVRQWIGELLLARDEPCVARNFLTAARHKWNQVFPQRAVEVSEILNDNEKLFGACPMLSEEDSERYCVAWIYGREDEFVA